MASSKNKNRISNSFGDKVFLCVDTILMALLFIIILYPLLYVVFASVTSNSQAIPLTLIPKKFTLTSYQAVFEYKDIWIGYKNSLIYMVVGTTISMIVTICAAYPMSVKEWMGNKIMVPMCLITMYISGGLIPTYLCVSKLHMVNSIWAVVIPGALSVHNLLVMRTFFSSQIPNEIRESASLDGCGNIRYLISIVLPLSGAVLAVIGLYYAVGSWNSYFGPMIYLKKRGLYPLTLITREILVQNQDKVDVGVIDSTGAMDLEARKNLMKYALIVVSCLPMLIIYPFVQKYFVKGVMIGAVKG